MERKGFIVDGTKQLRFPLAELHRNECKWPVHESRNVIGYFLFCAQPTELEQSYCQHHRAMASPRGTVENPVKFKVRMHAR